MKIEIKRIIWPSIISSLALLLFGILLIFYSAITLITISYVIGGILIALGVLAIFRFLRENKQDMFNQLNIVYGIVCILAGIFFIKQPKMIGSIIPFVFGISIVISSSLKIQQSLMLRKMNNRYFVGAFITSFLSFICGIILLFNPFKGAVVLTQVIGIFLALYAVFDIINTIFLKRSVILETSVSTDVKDERRKKKVKNAEVIREVVKKEEK